MITAYAVKLHGQEIDRVFLHTADTPEDARRGLIEHDGYDPAIVLRKVSTRVTAEVDAVSVRELDLWADNDATIYAQRKAIAAMLAKRIAKGTYDPKLAPKAWRYWFDAAAASYKRENGYQFPPAVRQACAEARAPIEHDRIVRGEYA